MDDNYFEVEESTPLLPEQQQAGDLSYIDLEPEGPRPPKRRKRVTQIGLVLVAIVVVGVTFHSLATPSRPAPAAATPEPTIPPPRTLIASNINFGTLSINGRQQRGTIPMFFSPPDGTYTLTIDAPPFQPRSCTFTVINGVPASRAPGGAYSTSDCEIDSGGFPAITANGITDSPRYVASINFDVTDLPPDQQNQINALLAHSISEQQTTTAPAGSYIATGFKANNTVTSRRITTPAKATASLAASTNFGLLRPPCGGLVCSTFGFDPEQLSNVTGMDWWIAVPEAIRWRFTTSAGRVMGDVSFPVSNIFPTLLAYTPDAGWVLAPNYVSGPFNAGSDIGAADCNTGELLLQQLLLPQNDNLNLSSSGPSGIEGCQMTVQDAGGSGRGTFIWRFGVLLAADAPAHKLLPGLPIAPQAEIAAVQG